MYFETISGVGQGDIVSLPSIYSQPGGQYRQAAFEASGTMANALRGLSQAAGQMGVLIRDAQQRGLILSPDQIEDALKRFHFAEANFRRSYPAAYRIWANTQLRLNVSRRFQS